MDSETVWLIIGGVLVLAYLALVVYLAIDLARRELALVAKIAWVVAFLVFPLLSVMVYVLVRGDVATPYPGKSGAVGALHGTGGMR